MRFSANWTKGQPQSKVYKFGYEIDASGRPMWKSEGIKSSTDFRTRASNTVMNPDRNQFNSLVLWLELNGNGIQKMSGNDKNTYFEINLIAQEDGSTSSKPPTVSFKKVTVKSAKESIPPADDADQHDSPTKTQIVSFTFESVKASWEGD
jgi:hypothetical protein